MRHKSDQNAQKYKARCDPTFVNFHKSMEKYKARCDRGAAHELRQGPAHRCSSLICSDVLQGVPEKTAFFAKDQDFYEAR